MASRLPASFSSRGLSRQLRTRILRLILLGWSPHAIAADCRVHLATVYKLTNNLLRYGSIKVPGYHKLGQPRKLTTADEEAIFELLLSEGWLHQDEIIFWLWYE
jgi:transposase